MIKSRFLMGYNSRYRQRWMPAPNTLPVAQISPPVVITSSPPIPSSQTPIVDRFSLLSNLNRAKKTTLNNEMRLALVKLCIENQAEYMYGGKLAFWKKMSVLLQQEHGVKLRDARSTVQDMVTARKIEVVKYRKESRTVQNDTELTQAVDQWITHLEVEDQKRRDSKKTPDILAKEAKEASVHRMNMCYNALWA